LGNNGNYELDTIPEYDVVVVGGGPAGITAAIRCMNHHLSVILVEGRKLGGQLIQLYPTKFIYDYSSYPEIRAGYLADRMVHHARYKNVPMLEDTPVESIDKEENMFRITMPKGQFLWVCSSRGKWAFRVRRSLKTGALLTQFQIWTSTGAKEFW
jgi:thioredoxin reductase (NADPH)